jgi:hypothetical protein
MIKGDDLAHQPGMTVAMMAENNRAVTNVAFMHPSFITMQRKINNFPIWPHWCKK